MRIEIQPYMTERAEMEKRRTGSYPQWYLDLKSQKVRTPSTPARTSSRRKRMPPADYEADLLSAIRCAGLPEPETQFQWHPRRKFRADFAYPDQKLLIEVQGGIYQTERDADGNAIIGADGRAIVTGGRHNRGAGYEKDRAKINEATLMGWRVLEFGPTPIKDGSAVETIRQALAATTTAME